MPGYDEVTPVEALKPGLLCLECNLLLKDPVQTGEGDRLCRSCYDEIRKTGVSQKGIKLGEEQVCDIFYCTLHRSFQPAVRCCCCRLQYCNLLLLLAS